MHVWQQSACSRLSMMVSQDEWIIVAGMNWQCWSHAGRKGQVDWVPSSNHTTEHCTDHLFIRAHAFPSSPQHLSQWHTCICTEGGKEWNLEVWSGWGNLFPLLDLNALTCNFFPPSSQMVVKVLCGTIPAHAIMCVHYHRIKGNIPSSCTESVSSKNPTVSSNSILEVQKTCLSYEGILILRLF